MRKKRRNDPKKNPGVRLKTLATLHASKEMQCPLVVNSKCKSCGHECHCNKADCDKCVNDVRVRCTCDNAVQLETDARQWTFK